MGQSIAKGIAGITGKRESRILMVGLDAAGKTTILYNLQLGEVVTTIPTIGFNVESVSHKNLTFTVWDVGGRSKIRPLWRHYYQNTQAVIFVIDSNDRDRLDEVKEELQHFVEEDGLRDAFYVLVANKQDLPNALSPVEIIQKLELSKFKQRWGMFPTAASTMDGLYDMMHWLSLAMTQPADFPLPPTTYSSATLGRFFPDGTDNAPSTAAAARAAAPKPAAAAAADHKTREAAVAALASAMSAAALAQPEMTCVEDDPIGWNPEAAHRRSLTLNANADLSDDELLEAVRSGTLPKNQYTHETMLRVMWVHLSRVVDRSKGRKVAVDGIMGDVKAYNERIERIFHMTHTYFWLQLVDLSLQMSGAIREKTRGGHVMPEPTAPQGANTAEVRRFFAECPWLLDHELMARYYSPNAVFADAEAFTSFKMPDLRQLPSILSFGKAAASA